MTIPEAAQLVIQAGAMASGGEVFVLDMGEPIRIVDLARRMVELSGMTCGTPTTRPGTSRSAWSGCAPAKSSTKSCLIGDNPLPTSHSAHPEGARRFPAVGRSCRRNWSA